jgi:hypothetical protein
VTPISLDYFLVDVLDREILPLKPPVEVPNQPELDPAVDPRMEKLECIVLLRNRL